MIKNMLRVLIISLTCLITPLSVSLTAYADVAPGSVGAWQTATNLPQKMTNATSVAYKGYIYSIGGLTGGPGGTELDNVYYAPINTDGSLGSWIDSVNSLPQQISWHTSVIVGDYIYAIGGQNQSFNVSDIVYFSHINSDGSVGAWQTATNLPQALYGSTSVTLNNYIYVMGGWTNTTPNKTDAVYYAHINPDGTITNWGTTTSLPDIFTDSGSTISNGYMYVLGGFSSSVILDTVYSAPINPDGTIGAWTASTNTLPEALYFPLITSYKGYIFSASGGTAYMGPGTTKNVYSAPINPDGTIGAWTASTNTLPQSFTDGSTTTYNGIMYVLGGGYSNDIVGSLDTVYYAQLYGKLDPVLAPTPVQPAAPSTGFGATLTGHKSSPQLNYAIVSLFLVGLGYLLRKKSANIN